MQRYTYITMELLYAQEYTTNFAHQINTLLTGPINETTNKYTQQSKYTQQDQIYFKLDF